jgi:hypothetical protein
VASAFGGQRSIQLSYGCVGGHLADQPGIGNARLGPELNKMAGLESAARPFQATVTRSNRVGYGGKAYAGGAGTVAGKIFERR